MNKQSTTTKDTNHEEAIDFVVLEGSNSIIDLDDLMDKQLTNMNNNNKNNNDTNNTNDDDDYVAAVMDDRSYDGVEYDMDVAYDTQLLYYKLQAQEAQDHLRVPVVARDNHNDINSNNIQNVSMHGNDLLSNKQQVQELCYPAHQQQPQQLHTNVKNYGNEKNEQIVDDIPQTRSENNSNRFVRQNLSNLVQRRGGHTTNVNRERDRTILEPPRTVESDDTMQMIPIAAEVVSTSSAPLPQLVYATPIRHLTKKTKIMIGCIVVVVVVAISIYFATDNKENSTTNSSYSFANENSDGNLPETTTAKNSNVTIRPISLPTSYSPTIVQSNGPTITLSNRPTITPSNGPTILSSIHSTDWNLDWFRLGPDMYYYSDDAAGTSVAVSRNGLSVVIGAPGNVIYDDDYALESGAYIYRFNITKWEQVALLEASYAFDQTGKSVAVDDSGLIVAIGSPYNNLTDIRKDGKPKHRGIVRINMINVNTDFSNDDFGDDDWTNSKRWDQIGHNLTGYLDDDEFGWAIDLTNDGKIITIGARTGCYAQSFQHSSNQDKWIEYGQMVNCSSSYEEYDEHDLSLHISGDGSTIILGEPMAVKDKEDGIICPSIGLVTMYRFDGNNWIQLGEKIYGSECKAEFGYSTAISDNGQIIASCSPLSNGGKPAQAAVDTSLEPSIGACHVYFFNDIINKWEQLGNNLTGLGLIFDKFGWSVSLNAAGSVIAIGAVGSNVNGDDSGYVRVLEYDSYNNTWISIGEDIVGQYGYAESGYSVALSSDGDKVTIGNPNTNLPGCSDRPGSVYVYETGAVFLEGPINITVSLFHDSEYDFVWFVDRMDVQRNDPVYIIDTYDADITPNETATYTAMVQNGVYRMIFDSSYNVTVDIYVNDQLIRSIENQTQSQFTFLTTNLSSSNESLTSQGNKKYQNNSSMTLSIDFDEKPYDIHWVVVRYDYVVDNNSRLILQHQRSIVAFGPQNVYGSELKNTQYNETINITNFSRESDLILIVTDDGRDGLCCEYGSGSIRLYNNDGLTIVSENNFNDTLRFIHRFSATEL